MHFPNRLTDSTWTHAHTCDARDTHDARQAHTMTWFISNNHLLLAMKFWSPATTSSLLSRASHSSRSLFFGPQLCSLHHSSPACSSTRKDLKASNFFRTDPNFSWLHSFREHITPFSALEIEPKSVLGVATAQASATTSPNTLLTFQHNFVSHDSWPWFHWFSMSSRGQWSEQGEIRCSSEACSNRVDHPGVATTLSSLTRTILLPLAAYCHMSMVGP